MITKDTLKQEITLLSLEEQLQQLIFDLIDREQEVSQKLLNTVADMLDMQANIEGLLAETDEMEAAHYKGLITDIEETALNSGIAATQQ